MPTFATQRILRAIVDERRRELSRALHHRGRAHVTDQIERLRDEAEAYRQQAIRLNAKLAAAADNLELRALREQLAESSARLDHAVTGLVEDVAAVRQVSASRP